MLTGNPTVLGSGNPVSTEPTGIEPLTDGAWCDFTNFGDLTCSEDRPHCGLSNHNLSGLELDSAPDLHPKFDCMAGSPSPWVHGKTSVAFLGSSQEMVKR